MRIGRALAVGLGVNGVGPPRAHLMPQMDDPKLTANGHSGAKGLREGAKLGQYALSIRTCRKTRHAFEDAGLSKTQHDRIQPDLAYPPASVSNDWNYAVVPYRRVRPALEISLDVEWAHAIAPKANIILVEASSSSFSALLTAVDVAVHNGASVVSMSWGGGESFGETRYDSSHFSHNGVTFTASSGDSGDGVIYPAASPDVIAVGGTTLKTDSNGNYATTPSSDVAKETTS